MSELHEPGDSWTRLLRRLRQDRRDLVEEVVAGTLALPEYQNRCGQITQIDRTLALAEEIRRGDDIRRPVSTPVENPEE